MYCTYISVPPDPTLTMENMNRVIAKVERKEREKVYRNVINTNARMKIHQQYSTYSEKEVAYVDAYVNCDPSASWQRLVKFLYNFHHMAAVEGVKSYLPPRGESTCMYSVHV